MTIPGQGPMDLNDRLIGRWDGRDYERHSPHQTRQPDGTHIEPFRRMNAWARKAGSSDGRST